MAANIGRPGRVVNVKSERSVVSPERKSCFPELWKKTCEIILFLSVFNTDMADEYDQYNASHAHSDYQYHRKIIVDIHPSN